MISLGWRDALRARVGVPVPLFVEDAGWRFRVDGAIELYDDDNPGVFPFQYWRGMLAIRGAHRWVLAIEGLIAAIGVTGSIEHESDHETYAGGSPAFTTWVFTDALALRGDLTIAWPEIVLSTGLTARIHFFTCTDVRDFCASGPLDGAQTFEAAFDFSLRTGSIPLDDGNVRFCSALHLDYVAPTSIIVEEARAGLDLGACIRFRDTGDWQLLAEGRVGSDVGMHRARSVVQAGVSLRWSL